MSRFSGEVAGFLEERPKEHGTLLIDGDVLAYRFGVAEDYEQAAGDLVAFVQEKKAAAGLKSATLLLTAEGSDKGGRYQIAKQKPYQGNRQGREKPPHHWHMRELMKRGEGTFAERVYETRTHEADDLFSFFAFGLPGAVVIHSVDKDMRMLPGWHLTWDTNTLVNVTQFKQEHEGNAYGMYCFWHQMLTGDAADNIPGLPGMVTKTKGLPGPVKKVGPATATKILEGVSSNEEARDIVFELYRDFFGTIAAPIVFLEQASLLWLQQDLNIKSWDEIQITLPNFLRLQATYPVSLGVEANKAAYCLFLPTGPLHGWNL